MSASPTTATPQAPEEETGTRRPNRLALALIGASAVILLMSAVRAVTGTDDLTSSGTFGAAIRLAVPIGLAGLGGLYSERTGVVNIGLEGMMVLGTWFGGWAGWEFGVWWGVLAGVLGGAAGGALHALATVTFGVDHIVSGVAVNLLAGGVARFLSGIVFIEGTGGGATQSPPVSGDIGEFDVPVLAGGELFGWSTPDVFGWMERTDVFLVADLGGLLKALTGDLSWLTVIAFVLVPSTWWFLWRTPTGLRMRSAGEHPWAAESLGVAVYRMKYIGVVVSGAMAGLGGAFLVVEAAGIYKEGQTAGRGFLGLAALISGNWRPTGTMASAGLFGFANALDIRSAGAVHALLLVIAISLGVAAVTYLARRQLPSGATVLLIGGAFLFWFLTTESVPSQLVFITPYVLTLLVLSFVSQRLRMPAADGARYRKGEQH